MARGRVRYGCVTAETANALRTVQLKKKLYKNKNFNGIFIATTKYNLSNKQFATSSSNYLKTNKQSLYKTE